MAETSHNLTNILKVTLDQYNTLKNGGTVGTHTYDSNALYLVKEDPGMTMRQALPSDPFEGIKTEVFFMKGAEGDDPEDGYIYIVDSSEDCCQIIDMGGYDSGNIGGPAVRFILNLSGEISNPTTYGQYVTQIKSATFSDYYLISEDEKTKLNNIQEQPIIWRKWS